MISDSKGMMFVHTTIIFSSPSYGGTNGACLISSLCIMSLLWSVPDELIMHHLIATERA
jgi:hypothetical protein